MATLSRKALYLGPSPWADEPSVEVLFALSTEELSRAPAGAEAVSRLLSHFFVPSSLPKTDLLSVGQFIVELARALLNEHGGVVAAASARLAPEGLVLTLGFHHPHASLLALEGAVRLLMGAHQAKTEEVAKAIQALWRQTVPFSPDPQASILIRSSRERGLPVRPLDIGARLWIHGWGARSDILMEASPRGDSFLGKRTASHKALTKNLAISAGFRILPSAVVTQASELEQASRAVGFPCVTKPVSGGQSKGVTVGIANPGELRQGFEAAHGQGKSPVLLERYAEGEPHRLMVLRGKLWKAIVRPRPTVVGDGLTTVIELVQARNQARLQGLRPSSLARPIPVDAALDACLARQRLSRSSVPAAGVRVRVREIPMLNQGAEGYEDMTGRMSAELCVAAERLATMMGVSSLGIDVMAQDISQPEGAYFLEANLTPGLRLLKEAGLSEVEIGQAVIGESPARIPSTLVLAARTDHVRILAQASRLGSVGWTDGRQVGIGEVTLPTAVRRTHDGVDLLVRNPAVGSLLVVCDPEELVAEGLPLDRLDSTLITAGASLPAEWEALVRRCSARVARKSVEGMFA